MYIEDISKFGKLVHSCTFLDLQPSAGNIFEFVHYSHDFCFTFTDNSESGVPCANTSIVREIRNTIPKLAGYLNRG